MELRRDEHHESDRPQTDPSALNAERAPVNPPFASEGLEQIRDSHC